MKLDKRASLLGALALTILGAGSLRAQTLAGQWKGRMEPTNLSAEIELNLRDEGPAWRADLHFRAGADAGFLPIEELRVESETVVVRTKIEGADVTFELAPADGLMLGSVRVTENGRVLVEGPAGLARAEDADGQARLTRWLDDYGASIDAARRDATIEKAAQLLLANYVYADLAERAASDIRERAKRGEYDAINSPTRLAELLGRHLAASTGDRHLHVKFGAERGADTLGGGEDETSDDLARLRRDAEAEHFGIDEPRMLEGNVGYLAFKRFFRAEVAGDALAGAMRRLADTDALIVDLRESRGGDPVMVLLAASWFFDGRPRHWNDMVRRYDDTTTQFWTAAWLPGSRYVDKPVYVLTSQRTFSAPESFAYEMQETGRATVVGETTGGGAHPGAWFAIDDGFSLFVPLSRYVSAVSGGDWEGSGVAPDVECSAPEAMECAQRLALRALGRE